MNRPAGQSGFAMVSVLLLMALLMSILAAYFSITRIEQSTTVSTRDSFRGFYAAEAGLNLRAEAVRQLFTGYGQPSGTSPDQKSATRPCHESNTGSGNFACTSYDVLDRFVVTFLEEPPDSPSPVVIPRGEAYQNLNGDEHKYIVHSMAENADGDPEALLEMHFKSRLVSLFQFAAFYNKDLEVLTDDVGLWEGPLHTNGDLYIGADSTGLDVTGQLTATGGIFRGPKHEDTCPSGNVRVMDADNFVSLPACSSVRREYTPADLTAFHHMILPGVDPLTVPTDAIIDAVPGRPYWDRADLRIVLDLNGGTPAIRVMQADGTENALASAALAACGSANYSTSFYDKREATAIKMLDVNLRDLLDCVHTAALFGGTKGLGDTTDGGIVLYLGVVGPNTDTVNNYGVRVGNAGEIASTDASAPVVRGLTIVTNQAIYLWGRFNMINKKPAAVLADSLNLLSNAWNDGYSGMGMGARLAADTGYQAAFLAGTDMTGGAEGSSGRDAGQYNGGLEHFPRLHEHWAGRTLYYRGSLVSLGPPRRVDGALALDGSQFSDPVRNWNFDIDFEDASMMPPMPPRFVYLRQELFVRHFEL